MLKRIQTIILLALWVLAMLWLPGPLARAQEGGDASAEYRVKPGDTLLSIAQRFDVPVELLAEVNGIEDPNLIRVGQSLVIPGAEAATLARRASVTRDLSSESREALIRTPITSLVALGSALGLLELRTAFPAMSLLAIRDPDLPFPFLAVNASQSIVQGQTGVIRVTVAAPIPPLGRFQGRPLIFMEEKRAERGFHYFALIPTGALDKPGEKNLQLTIGNIVWQQPVVIREGDYATQHIVLPPSKGNLLEPKKLTDERERLAAIWNRISAPPRWDSPFLFPIGDGFQRTSPYGTRRSYNGGPVSSFHAGTDWGAPEGTPILAPAPGVIVLAEFLTVRGGAVVIDHGAGVFSNFWHMSRIDVRPGDVVQTGDQLGLVGTTGLSTGAHLHWEVRVNGLAVNPMQWTDTLLP